MTKKRKAFSCFEVLDSKNCQMRQTFCDFTVSNPVSKSLMDAVGFAIYVSSVLVPGFG